MAWVYILRGQSGRHYIGSTDDLRRRLEEHQRGSNHTTRRLGGHIELVAARQLSTIAEARTLEFKLKRKKNPQVAVFLLESSCST
jgi:putative endonuclease